MARRKARVKLIFPHSVTQALPFTGERFLPECEGEIGYEHWHRYAFAAKLSQHRAVLDVACGEGYGAAMMAESATSVIGVDISADAVHHASTRYGQRATLQFVRASCDRLPFAEASFDLAISFETIEHIATQQAFVAELARVLRPNGVLILSSPNKRLYSDAPGYCNEFHVRELYRNELDELLGDAFPHRSWFGQRLLFHSTIWPEGRLVREINYLVGDGGTIASTDCPTAEPMYFIAACCRDPSPLPTTLDGLSLFSDATETVYRDYLRQTRRVAELDHLLIDRERLIAERDQLLALRTEQMESSGRQIVERDNLLLARAEQIAERDGQLLAREQQLARLDSLLLAREQAMAELYAVVLAHGQKIAACEVALAECAGQIAERDALLVTRAGQIAERDGLLAARAGQIAERDSLLMALDTKLGERLAIISERDKQLMQSAERQAELHRELVHRASLVWWLRSPWRFIKRAFRDAR